MKLWLQSIGTVALAFVLIVATIAFLYVSYVLAVGIVILLFVWLVHKILKLSKKH